MKPQRKAIGEMTPKSLHGWLTNHSRVLAGQVSFGATMSNNAPDRNIKCWKFTGTSPGAANTDFTLQHGLGYVPAMIMGQDTKDGSVIYRSPATPWTKTTVTLRSTGVFTVYNVAVA